MGGPYSYSWYDNHTGRDIRFWNLKMYYSAKHIYIYNNVYSYMNERFSWYTR
jgi:hypothetical protein